MTLWCTVHYFFPAHSAVPCQFSSHRCRGIYTICLPDFLFSHFGPYRRQCYNFYLFQLGGLFLRLPEVFFLAADAVLMDFLTAHFQLPFPAKNASWSFDPVVFLGLPEGSFWLLVQGFLTAHFPIFCQECKLIICHTTCCWFPLEHSHWNSVNDWVGLIHLDLTRSTFLIYIHSMSTPPGKTLPRQVCLKLWGNF